MMYDVLSLLHAANELDVQVLQWCSEFVRISLSSTFTLKNLRGCQYFESLPLLICTKQFDGGVYPIVSRL